MPRLRFESGGCRAIFYLRPSILQGHFGERLLAEYKIGKNYPGHSTAGLGRHRRCKEICTSVAGNHQKSERFGRFSPRSSLSGSVYRFHNRLNCRQVRREFYTKSSICCFAFRKKRSNCFKPVQVFLSTAPDRFVLKCFFHQTRSETTKNIAWELKVVHHNLYLIYLVIIELITKIRN